MFARFAELAQPALRAGVIRRTRAARFVLFPRASLRVDSILYSADRKAQVTLPSHFWSKPSIERALEAAGFEAITWEELAADKGAPEAVATTKGPMPVGIFTARLA